jgi:uncharacterized protein (TIGR03083 family)
MQVPIPTLHLFPQLETKLLDLLRSLSPDEWQRPTRAKLWTVKDITAHLLDGNIRTISMSRDKYFGEKAATLGTHTALVAYLNQLNADWVKATKRLSPAVLIELLEITGVQYLEHLQSLDPFGSALFSVGWAGEAVSPNWFHVAREYTEKWHHQQQIREAVQRPGIETRELYHPVLNTFMQALPHTYRNVGALPGTEVKIVIVGEAGGAWCLTRVVDHWKMGNTYIEPPQAEISLDQEIAWKLFTKGLSSREAEKAVTITGDRALGEPVLSMLAVMA